MKTEILEHDIRNPSQNSAKIVLRILEKSPYGFRENPFQYSGRIYLKILKESHSEICENPFQNSG